MGGEMAWQGGAPALQLCAVVASHLRMFEWCLQAASLVRHVSPRLSRIVRLAPGSVLFGMAWPRGQACGRARQPISVAEQRQLCFAIGAEPLERREVSVQISQGRAPQGRCRQSSGCATPELLGETPELSLRLRVTRVGRQQTVVARPRIECATYRYHPLRERSFAFPQQGRYALYTLDEDAIGCHASFLASSLSEAVRRVDIAATRARLEVFSPFRGGGQRLSLERPFHREHEVSRARHE